MCIRDRILFVLKQRIMYAGTDEDIRHAPDEVHRHTELLGKLYGIFVIARIYTFEMCIRDRFIGIKKRFKADLLQRSYRQFSEQFGYSKRQVTEAIKALETLGVIRREFRTVSTNMQKLSNVLYIELFPDKLMELTYPERCV